MKRKLVIVGAVVALILLLDQLIKVWIKTSFTEDSVNIFGNWFRLIYVENPGMAFGTTFGSGMWAKLALSIFRIVAITGIAIYWFKQAKAGMKLEFLIAIGLIFAGATGNLIDSMVYDFIFPYDPCMIFNHMPGSGIFSNCGFLGEIETRHTGFLLGNVVDMFQFNFTWPTWVPVVGGNEVFPAVWNVADASISVGVLLVLFRQRTYFPKVKKAQVSKEKSEDETA